MDGDDCVRLDLYGNTMFKECSCGEESKVPQGIERVELGDVSLCLGQGPNVSNQEEVEQIIPQRDKVQVERQKSI